jgi:hypothetical protein
MCKLETTNMVWVVLVVLGTLVCTSTAVSAAGEQSFASLNGLVCCCSGARDGGTAKVKACGAMRRQPRAHDT